MLSGADNDPQLFEAFRILCTKVGHCIISLYTPGNMLVAASMATLIL